MSSCGWNGRRRTCVSIGGYRKVGAGGITLDRHEAQTGTDPTSEQWLALHHAFGRYCEARPWERLASEDVLVVNDPLGHFKGYCVALGDGGVAYGLGVHLGDRGLLNYLTTMMSRARTLPTDRPPITGHDRRRTTANTRAQSTPASHLSSTGRCTGESQLLYPHWAPPPQGLS